jgi:hypothetical protein
VALVVCVPSCLVDEDGGIEEGAGLVEGAGSVALAEGVVEGCLITSRDGGIGARIEEELYGGDRAPAGSGEEGNFAGPIDDVDGDSTAGSRRR